MTENIDSIGSEQSSVASMLESVVVSRMNELILTDQVNDAAS